MSYIKDNLMPNEKIFFTARVSPAVFLRSIVSFVLTIAVFIYGLNNTVGVITKANSASPENTATALWGSFLLLASGILFLNSILLGLQALIIMSTTEFAVTNRRVIAKHGFIRWHTLEMLLSKVESVTVSQNILGRLLNFGTVTVTGTGGTKESFRAIVEPIAVRKKINNIIEGYMQHQQKLSNPQAGG